ncbi:MAG: putative ABC transporter permease, partial [Ruminococcus sp.]|nr:putative ABC transporter permease [Ruminococcus sp.]
PVLTFVIVFFGCSGLEFCTALYLDKVKHIKYCNYTGYFGNIDGKVCVEGAMVFGFAACATIYILGPLVDDILKRMKPAIKVALCTTLSVMFILDLVYTNFNPNEGEGITDYSSVTVYQDQQDNGGVIFEQSD